MTITIRERRPDDLPVLAEVLAEQQPSSQYPIRWPLPIPIEDFLVRPGEERAWVAEVGGRVAGHVAVYELGGPLRDDFIRGAGRDDLAELAVLFVALDVIGTGVGGRLLDTAVAWIRSTGRIPVLDVVPMHDRALQVYEHRGWRAIGEAWPEFLGKRSPLVLMVLDGRP